jgi:hypothetical protein
MLKNPTSIKRDTSSAKFTAISRQVSPTFLLGVSPGNCHIALVDESGMAGTQMGMQNRFIHSYMKQFHYRNHNF